MLKKHNINRLIILAYWWGFFFQILNHVIYSEIKTLKRRNFMTRRCHVRSYISCHKHLYFFNYSTKFNKFFYSNYNFDWTEAILMFHFIQYSVHGKRGALCDITLYIRYFFTMIYFCDHNNIKKDAKEMSIIMYFL